ncbi:substrate-binding periplasmic protein [Verminephrobacter eiseniae]|uniref:substrate-binding periplasmic protein n=1 Tax=Verminephrobacter eiseniae TaxID=364317 RepID=UPI0022381D7F|nr:transporter substrate-binding domain-containing protein [Verminephrobacter eiseniae]
MKKTLPRWGRSDPSNSWGRSGRASAALPARAAVARRAGRAVGLVGLGALAAALLGGGISALAQTPPAPGVSARVDAIRKAGALRVGVVNNPPWLAQNTSGAGEPWSGPSWTLGKEFARLLGVQIQPVVVSHETKVPALVANQMDIMIGPLNETAARAKVIDFVIFSNTGVCLFGRADNPRFTGVQTLEDFNRPELTIAYFSGAGEEPLVRQHFAKAKLRGVANSGSVAPIEEVLAGRSDMAPINRMLWPSISKKLKGLAVFPKENDCQDSKIFQIDTGMGVAKEQPAYLEWLRAVARRMQPALTDEERRATQNLK